MAADGRYDQAPVDSCEWTDATEVPRYRIKYCCQGFRGCGFYCFEFNECFNACGDPLHPPFQELVLAQIHEDDFDPWFPWDITGCGGF